jgi:hypothetical protein
MIFVRVPLPVALINIQNFLEIRKIGLEPLQVLEFATAIRLMVDA